MGAGPVRFELGERTTAAERGGARGHRVPLRRRSAPGRVVVFPHPSTSPLQGSACRAAGAAALPLMRERGAGWGRFSGTRSALAAPSARRGGAGRDEARRGARAAKVCARAPPPLRPRRAGPSRAAPSPAGSATGGMRRRQVREGGEPRGEGGEGGSARRDGAGLGAAELRAPLGSSPRACRSIAARSRRSVAAGRDRAFGFGPRGPPTPCRAEARSVRGTPAFLPPFPVPPFCYDRDAGLWDALKGAGAPNKAARSSSRRSGGPRSRRTAPRCRRPPRGQAAQVGSVRAGRRCPRDGADGAMLLGAAACFRCVPFCAGGSSVPGGRLGVSALSLVLRFCRGFRGSRTKRAWRWAVQARN